MPLANAVGVHDASTAELALGLAIASLRGIDAAVHDQERGRWAPSVHTSLADRRVLVVGTGGVGTAIARRLEPFEVAITRVASSARLDHLSDRFGTGARGRRAARPAAAARRRGAGLPAHAGHRRA